MNSIRLISATLVLAAAALCQTDRATITGTVRDASGALIADAKLHLTYPDTGLKRSVASNSSGAYLFAGLPLERVLIQAERPGFRIVNSEVMLGGG
jgi:Carboxypeptidase regulatory-like domain